MNVELVNATLYQPDSVLSERIETKSLSHFIRIITEATHEALATATQPEMLDVFVIVRPIEETDPGDNVRVWMLSSAEAAIDDFPDRSELVQRLHAVPVPSVTGPIAFTLAFSVAGALAPAEPVRWVPTDWQMAAALSGKGPESAVIPDDLIPALWSTAPPSAY